MSEHAARWLDGVDQLVWEPVGLGGPGAPWLGISCDLDVGRPWVWELVTPETYRAIAPLRDDPMALVSERDVVLVHLDTGGTELWMQVPVVCAPDSVKVPGHALRDGWQLSLEAAWSRRAVERALDSWSLLERGRTLEWPDDGRGDQERYDVGGGMAVTASAFDVLLGLDEAGDVTEVFSAVLAALGEHVDRPG